MSRWTHITACLSVETKMELEKSLLKKKLKELLKDSPKITGSEQDADIFINLPSGFNTGGRYDCECCKYGNTYTLRSVVSNEEEYTTCSKPKYYRCNKKYQTCAVISIQGDLRDRRKKDTQKEFDLFLKYLVDSFGFYIRDYAVNIKEE